MKTQRAAKELAEFRAGETYHRREWFVQRVGWVLLFLLIMSACLGLLGHGPLAQRTLTTSSGVLEMDRFARREATTEWKIRPAGHFGADREFVIRISSAFLQRYEISAVDPEPVTTSLADRNVVLKFIVADPNGSIVFHVEPQHAGMNAGEVQLGDSEPLEVKQFVYP